MKKRINIFWFRRDLRLHDNRALFMALGSGLPVLPVFIFDTDILNRLQFPNDARVNFIYSEIQEIKQNLEKRGGSLKIFYCPAAAAFKKLSEEYEIQTIFAGKDFEPKTIERDAKVAKLLKTKNINFELYSDHVLFEPGEIVKDDKTPYTVFTPYSKKWKSKFSDEKIKKYPSENLLENFLQTSSFHVPELEEMGFVKSDIPVPVKRISENNIADYHKNRDFPGLNATTRLGVHLRFGTVSIREISRYATQLSEVFLNELIWRNFFIDILWHFPHVETNSFKTKYDFIVWRNNEHEFEKWCRGETGFPLVDAGMRELNETGFMHNRVRMVTAGFLIKHLLIDWRWGEAYFAERLLDFELASNNGNWQWAAGCGCDAAPYFRIFNPETQLEKFDKNEEYIRKWVPEYKTLDYPKPMVDHKTARERALKVFKKALEKYFIRLATPKCACFLGFRSEEQNR